MLRRRASPGASEQAVHPVWYVALILVWLSCRSDRVFARTPFFADHGPSVADGSDWLRLEAMALIGSGWTRPKLAHLVGLFWPIC